MDVKTFHSFHSFNLTREQIVPNMAFSLFVTVLHLNTLLWLYLAMQRQNKFKLRRLIDNTDLSLSTSVMTVTRFLLWSRRVTVSVSARAPRRRQLSVSLSQLIQVAVAELVRTRHTLAVAGGAAFGARVHEGMRGGVKGVLVLIPLAAQVHLVRLFLEVMRKDVEAVWPPLDRLHDVGVIVVAGRGRESYFDYRLFGSSMNPFCNDHTHKQQDE